MGKPKLAGSVRRYVATKLSRVSKRITGSCQSNTEHQVSTAQPDSHSSLLAPSVQVLPVTKIPALDTVDRYAADEPIVDLEDSVGKSPRVKLSCSSDVRNVIGNLLRGYACFIAAFTGFEDVAFLSNRSPPFAESKPSRSLVIASVASGDSQSKVDLLEVDAKTHDQDEVQFYAEIGFGVSSENGWRTSTAGFKTVGFDNS
ncbi:uncharacterized protein BJX67DRAFT_22600 [Aspergillus lucknowensis]|uniref:Ornithine decarboxylase antizyme n=1 Tax=Aspergillus lucknowensis TaxID=176173 RepID=A0ABR4LXG5_9EURO